jgi:hypothetical protein
MRELKNKSKVGYKGEKASYVAKHMWIYKYYGKARFCIIDKRHQTKRFAWANLSKTYKRDMSDWVPMCYSCHAVMDKYKYTLEKMRRLYVAYL